MNDTLLNTIETIYDCIGDEFNHDRALEAYSKATDDTGLIVAEVKPLLGGFGEYHYYNIPDEAVDAMVNRFDSAETHDAFKVFNLLPERTPILRRVFVPDEIHHHTRLYKETSKPWGIHSDGTCILHRGQIASTTCSFVRFPGQKETDQELLGIMAVINNHYHRAMMLQGRLNALEQTLIQSSNMLDLIDFGVILYGRQAEPAFVNAAAQRIIDQQDGVCLSAKKLRFLDHNANQVFQGLVSALYHQNLPMHAKSGGAFSIPRASGGKAYSAMVVPMQGPKDMGEGSATAAIFLFDPTASRTSAMELFVASYGLSRSEAELAQRLALGDSLEEAAERRGVSRNTAKSQLRSVFAKTDTQRQSELVSLLLHSVAGINLEAP